MSSFVPCDYFDGEKQSEKKRKRKKSERTFSGEGYLFRRVTDKFADRQALLLKRSNNIHQNLRELRQPQERFVPKFKRN